MDRITLLKPDGARIDKNIYGHFAEHLGHCIYQGIFVGKDSPIPNDNGIRRDVAEAMRRIRLPLLRWPGGCFADVYHWRDGIGAPETRRRTVNSTWGGDVEDNSFGTHEFLELCRQVGCEPYVNANIGSGGIQEMADWVEYLNCGDDSSLARERSQNGHSEPFRVRYWGVGNETWGGGGNMRPEYYADEYRRYQTYCRNYSGTNLYRIACGPNSDDYTWTEVLMKQAARFMEGLSLHYYTVPKDWEDKGSATEFDVPLYLETLKKANHMDELITRHSAIMDRYDPECRVALIVDEWGCWHNVEPDTNPSYLYQQNTMRDAMVAAVTLNIFNRHCKRVTMANIAQTVNVLQSIILTRGDKMVLTPTYHVFDLFKAHMDAEHLGCAVECGQLPNGLSQLSVSASQKEGLTTLTLANLSATDEAQVEIVGVQAGSVRARMLCDSIQAHNTFGQPEAVAPRVFEGVARTASGLSVALPPCSIVELTLRP